MSPSTDPQRPRLPWLRFVVVALLVALDLWSKWAVFEWLSQPMDALVDSGVQYWTTPQLATWRYPLAGDFLGFLLSENRGAAWGLGDSVPWLLVGARVIASVVLVGLLWRAPAQQPWTRAALVLILAGALGNLWDNLTRTPPEGHPFGAVRDFIHVYFTSFDYHFPTFNVADSCITVGAGILIVGGLFGGRREAPAEADGEQPAVSSQ
ncbi:MAG: signal peptidase II [Planctomycetota bacterium]